MRSHCPSTILIERTPRAMSPLRANWAPAYVGMTVI
jgi:hypothetical protein